MERFDWLYRDDAITTPHPARSTMSSTALGYIGIRSRRPEDWEDFATRWLGMQQVDRGGG